MHKHERMMGAVSCVSCKQALPAFEGDKVSCPSCLKEYPVAGGVFFSYSNGDIDEEKKDDSFFYKLKTFSKKSPIVYRILSYVFGAPTIHTSGREFVRNMENKDELLILNIGAGNKILPDSVVNLDIYPYVGVSVVADAAQIPFLDNSVDAIVCDNLLEHVKDPGKIVEELYRILKPGGKIFVGVPFIIQFHSSPYDYRRWTHMGLEELMIRFKKEELKVAHGPTSAAMNILGEWLATLLSFGSSTLYQILLVLFIAMLSPIKVLDLIIARYPSAKNSALSFYYIGRKS